jgi:6-phosphofructokinase
MCTSAPHALEHNFSSFAATCQKINLDGLVFIGSSESCQRVGQIAEFFAEKGIKTKVVASVQHVDGGKKIDFLPVGLGFDTVARVYAQYVGDLCSFAMSI